MEKEVALHDLSETFSQEHAHMRSRLLAHARELTVLQKIADKAYALVSRARYASKHAVRPAARSARIGKTSASDSTAVAAYAMGVAATLISSFWLMLLLFSVV